MRRKKVKSIWLIRNCRNMLGNELEEKKLAGLVNALGRLAVFGFFFTILFGINNLWGSRW